MSTVLIVPISLGGVLVVGSVSSKQAASRRTTSHRVYVFV